LVLGLTASGTCLCTCCLCCFLLRRLGKPGGYEEEEDDADGGRPRRRGRGRGSVPEKSIAVLSEADAAEAELAARPASRARRRKRATGSRSGSPGDLDRIDEGDEEDEDGDPWKQAGRKGGGENAPDDEWLFSTAQAPVPIVDIWARSFGESSTGSKACTEDDSEAPPSPTLQRQKRGPGADVAAWKARRAKATAAGATASSQVAEGESPRKGRRRQQKTGRSPRRKKKGGAAAGEASPNDGNASPPPPSPPRPQSPLSSDGQASPDEPELDSEALASVLSSVGRFRGDQLRQTTTPRQRRGNRALAAPASAAVVDTGSALSSPGGASASAWHKKWDALEADLSASLDESMDGGSPTPMAGLPREGLSRLPLDAVW